jgi:hypothetical protein
VSGLPGFYILLFGKYFPEVVLCLHHYIEAFQEGCCLTVKMKALQFFEASGLLTRRYDEIFQRAWICIWMLNDRKIGRSYIELF